MRRILDAGVEMHRQIVYINGEEVGRIDLSLPADVPFEFFCIPQYDTGWYPRSWTGISDRDGDFAGSTGRRAHRHS